MRYATVPQINGVIDSKTGTTFGCYWFRSPVTKPSIKSDDKQRRIVQLRLAGYSNQEIAKDVQISLRSVERKVEVVRDVWSAVLDE